MPKRYIYPLNRKRLPRTVGEKAKNLHYLDRKGFPIPSTYAITWDLKSAYYANGEHYPAFFCRDLERVLDIKTTYAVRSSANVEDAHSQSYAGQFHSVLGVQGVDNILGAIREVWDSSHLEAPQTYHNHHKSNPTNVKMGVVLQEMIPAQFSGVAFSRNPITGLDEVVIEAIKGSGVAILQDGITPLRWVWKWGKWLQQPEESSIPLELIEEIAIKVTEISESCGHPVDVEWVFNGTRVIWLQMRAITALESIDIYANHIPKEFLPGVIKPLVWSINVPLVNGAWVRLLTEMIGKNQVDPLRLARSFHGHAYFNMGLLGTVFQKIGLPENALERLMGFEAEGDYGPSFRPSLKAFQHLPRMIKFIIGKAWFDKKFAAFFGQALVKYADLEAQDVDELADDDLLDHIEKLYLLNQETAYFNIVIPLLMQIYHRMAKRSLESRGISYERINWLIGWKQRAEYEPLAHLRELGAIFNTLEPIEQKLVYSLGLEAQSGSLVIFKRQLQLFMDRFGHLSDSGNDFSFPLWKETPGLVHKMIASFAKTPPMEKNEQEAISVNQLNVRGTFIERASRYSRYREQISFLYTRGISLFRDAFVSIGEDFMHKGWLENTEDIFFLKHEEIDSAIRQGKAVKSLVEIVRKRKEDDKLYQSVRLPSIIYGEHLPSILDNTSVTLAGIPASKGWYDGVICVVKGIGDFSKVTDGCVLVIPYSDVSWIPLFARAGAIVAESGGILSHSSIIAREYGIPAIVSVPNATRLSDGMEVTVDGFSGRIIIKDRDNAEEIQ